MSPLRRSIVREADDIVAEAKQLSNMVAIDAGQPITREKVVRYRARLTFIRQSLARLDADISKLDDIT